ncbi:DUF4347 domain-containing protein, partial [Ramlibacter sp.]|uniref:DUF4347 domain-containing protein n=1 Tax=Ramlibacter sp. TaxID=1917967 RepID=UPI003D104876
MAARTFSTVYAARRHPGTSSIEVVPGALGHVSVEGQSADFLRLNYGDVDVTGVLSGALIVAGALRAFYVEPNSQPASADAVTADAGYLVVTDPGFFEAMTASGAPLWVTLSESRIAAVFDALGMTGSAVPVLEQAASASVDAPIVPAQPASDVSAIDPATVSALSAPVPLSATSASVSPAMVVPDAPVAAALPVEAVDVAAAELPISPEPAQAVPATAAPEGTELIFIDPTAGDVEGFLQGVKGQVVRLTADRDGFEQIAEALAGRSGVTAIHVLGHGEPGEIRLGSTVLNSGTIGGYTDLLGRIGSSMAADADILLYGCDVAQGDGPALIDAIAQASGADVAASTNATGAASKQGDWVLEASTGAIEAATLTADQFDNLLTVAISAGDGALIGAYGNTFWSVDVTSGKAIQLTTVPGTIGIHTLSAVVNSVAVDQANNLIYYVDSESTSPTTWALFAYNYITNTHFVVNDDLRTAGVTVGSRGVGSGAATFYNNTLFLGVEQNVSTTNTIYKITFTNSGQTVNTVSTFTTNTGVDWGDIGYYAASNWIISGNTNNIIRYNATTGSQVSTATHTWSGPQLGESNTGKAYVLSGSTVREYTPTSTSMGTSINVTTNGTTTMTLSMADGAGWTPPTGSVSGQIYVDANANGVLDSGEQLMGNVTVEIREDRDNDGVYDTSPTAERLLATDTTDANGNFSFTGALPGHYIVRVTDTNGALGASPTYSPASGVSGTGDVLTIGQVVTGVNIGVTSAVPGITVTGAPITTTEAGTTGTFTLRLTKAPTANVVLTISGLDASEHTISGGNTRTFTTANWNTAQTVTVTGVDDSLIDGNIAYSLTVVSSGAATYTGANARTATVSVTNVDNDVGSVIAGSAITTSEAGTTQTYTLRLGAQPVGDVVLTMSGLDATEGSLSASALTFTTANWNTNQTVTVTGVNDDLIDGSITYTLTATSSGDAGYSGTNAKTATVAVTNLDNDVSGLTLTGGPTLTTTEATGTTQTKTFTAVLDKAPAGNVTVTLTGLDATEGSLSASTLTFTTANWNTAQTVTVTGADDVLIDGDITYTLTATTGGDATYAGTNAKSATINVRNVDDDVSGLTLTGGPTLTTTEATGTGQTKTFTAVLDKAPAGNVTVTLTGLDATEGSLSASTLTFTTANWNTAQTVTVTGANDDLIDGNITYTLTATTGGDA